MAQLADTLVKDCLDWHSFVRVTGLPPTKEKDSEIMPAPT
jgi:hypothetical protein